MAHVINIQPIDADINHPPNNKLRLLWIERLFKQHRNKIKYLQLAMLIAFLTLIIVPMFAKIPKFSDTILTSTVLLSQFLFWGIWYSACLFSVIPFGRLWCGLLCPLGALSEWSGKFGLKRTIPSWMQWNGWLVVMFTIVTILGQTLDVRDDPAGMAKLFLYIFILAILLGFIYGQNNGRPWCRYYCPIGKILGVVSRLGVIDFKANKGVIPLSKKQNYYTQGRLCPTDYNLPYKTSTNNCIACGACAYGKKKGGMGIYRRKPGEEILDILNRHPNWSEVIFILFSPGLSAGGFLWLILHQYQQYRDAIGGWFLDKNIMWIFNRAPAWLSSQRWNQHYSWLDVTMITGYMLTYSIVIGLISTALITLAALCLRTTATSFKKMFVLLTYQYTPVAILSIVIGLSGKFFEVLNHDFNMSLTLAIGIKFFLLGISMLWALHLTLTVIRRLNDKSLTIKLISFAFILMNVAIILYMWWPAILGHTYMSEVEQIRKHIIVPGS